jgi:NADPH:quinone reductase-like Zn-dependent oxidoreductase
MGRKSELLTAMKLIAAGKLKPILDRTFPLAQTSAAHAYLESGKQFGKVVIQVA